MELPRLQTIWEKHRDEGDEARIEKEVPSLLEGVISPDSIGHPVGNPAARA